MPNTSVEDALKIGTSARFSSSMEMTDEPEIAVPFGSAPAQVILPAFSAEVVSIFSVR